MARLALKLPLIALLVALAVPGAAFADTRLYSQELTGFTEDQNLGGTNGYPAQQFVATQTGTVLSVALAQTTNACGSPAVWENSTRLDGGAGGTGSAITGGYRYTFNWTWNMVSGRTYKLVCGNNSSAVVFSGISNDLGANYAGHSNLGTTFNANPAGGFSLLHWQYSVCSDTTCNLGSTSTTTRIISEDLPGSGATATSTSVTFQFQYYFNDTTDTYDRAGVDISDITVPQSIVGTEDTISASGGATYHHNVSLSANHEYLWRAYLRDSSTGQHLYGDTRSFFTVGNPYPLNTNVASSSIGSSTESNILSYQNMLSLVANHPPFGFIFQVITALNSVQPSTTPAVVLEKETNIYTDIFHPLDVGLAAVIGFPFVVYLFRRFSHLDL